MLLKLIHQVRGSDIHDRRTYLRQLEATSRSTVWGTWSRADFNHSEGMNTS